MGLEKLPKDSVGGREAEGGGATEFGALCCVRRSVLGLILSWGLVYFPARRRFLASQVMPSRQVRVPPLFQMVALRSCGCHRAGLEDLSCAIMARVSESSFLVLVRDPSRLRMLARLLIQGITIDTCSE